MTKTRKKSSSEITYMEYISYLINQLIENGYAPSYSTFESMRKWYFEMPYTPETLQFVIEKSICFIQTLTRDRPTCTDPVFLNALTDKMTDYLSGYAIREIPEIAARTADHDAYRAARNAAKAKIKDELFNCKYIQMLFAKQREKRQIRATSRESRLKNKALREIEAAEKAREISKQVQREFRTMQQLARKR